MMAGLFTVRRRTGPDISELAEIKLFASGTASQLRQLARVAELTVLPAGLTLLREGELVNELIVVIDGYIERRRQGRHVGLLHPGEWTDPRPLIGRLHSEETLATASTARVAVLGLREFNAALDEVDGMGQRL